MKKQKLIEVGFTYRGSLYVFSALAPEPVGYLVEPGTGFKRIAVAERIEIECTIKPEGDHTGEVNAHWHRIEKRLLDAAPTASFMYQPQQGPEQEELFSGLLNRAEECIRDAMYFASKAAQDKKEITQARKHLS